MYSAATPEKGASTLSIFFSKPLSPMRKELREPLVELLWPRLRQYSSRCFESMLSHEGFSPASRVFDVTERL